MTVGLKLNQSKKIWVLNQDLVTISLICLIQLFKEILKLLRIDILPLAYLSFILNKKLSRREVVLLNPLKREPERLIAKER